ncbi:hypothetical protein LTR82_012120 [Friedmanniomyces endolithicus]|uniref:Uncharacterized protein n=1 Tax=Friedmanniomyces endolithicus TaxID=329885 RepID=A0AAN6FGA5_9PEZI|nr:hypothetical protein LTR82_012120 [Friedmanniomyces endolithicus]
MDDYLESTIRLYLARAAPPVVHQQSHSILFTLPAELREEIYKQCPAETFTATLVRDMPSIETLTFDITGLQDLVESRAIYVFSGRTIQMMLFCLLLDFHKSHSATGWLPGSMEIRIVGRDPSGEHTLLQLGPGYLRPVLDRSLDAEKYLVCSMIGPGIDSSTGRMIPSLYYSTGCRVATIRCVPWLSNDQGSLILSEDQQHLHWTEAEPRSVMGLSRTITLSEVYKVLRVMEVGPGLRPLVCWTDASYIFVSTSEDAAQQEYDDVCRLFRDGERQRSVRAPRAVDVTNDSYSKQADELRDISGARPIENPSTRKGAVIIAFVLRFVREGILRRALGSNKAKRNVSR